MKIKSIEMRDQQLELKHVCKFCSKSFACGRALGGHMRSHMINDTSSLADGTKLTKKRLPPLSTYLPSNSNPNNHSTNKDTSSISPGSPGYILRKNTRGSWKFSDHNNSGEDKNTSKYININNNPVLLDKSCKECGKVFHSWKALFGHMKFHSNNNNSLEEEEEQEQYSWTIANNNNNSNQKLDIDSQSDNEMTAPSRRKRSKRRTKYTGNTANSLSLSVPNDASSSVSEIKQEQEEVALCLILLSRDVRQWVGLNFLAESSDNNSESVGTNPITGKNSDCNGREALKAKVKTIDDKKPETSASGMEKFPEENQCENENSRVEMGTNLMEENGTDEVKADGGKCIFLSNKRKSIDYFDPEMEDSLKKFKAIEAEGSSKFECTTCNKVFHSYQALGGHRASHRKIKGSFASKIDSGENSIETESSPDQISDGNKLIAYKIIKPTSHEIPADKLATNYDEKAEMINGTKKNKGHECPVCLKVFPSGQALGGHKRAHMGGDAEAKNNQAVSTQEPIPAIRDFLDLNLPAPVEEESNGIVGLSPWWSGRSHNHKPLFGLITN